MVKKKLKKIVKKWKRYHEISDVGPITRRYFIMNAFDGALTMLGVVIGAAISGNLGNSNIIISAGIAGSIAATTKGLQALGGGSTGASSSTPTTKAQPQAPNFNIVGATETSQLADAVAGQTQQPVQAYVVANDVTTAQSLENNIVEGATL